MSVPIETRYLRVERQMRYATHGASPAVASEFWFVLHGYGQLAPQFLRHFLVLDDGGRRVVAAEGLHRYYLDHDARKVGASWMTSEDRLTDIADYVAYLDRLYAVEVGEGRPGPVPVVALGFSQGVHTLCRWLAFGGSRIDVAVLWGAGVPPDLDLEEHADRLRRPRLFLVAGEEDAYFSAEAVEKARARLAAAAIPVETLRYPGGHGIEEEALRSLATAARSVS